jgi:hypothetical protein
MVVWFVWLAYGRSKQAGIADADGGLINEPLNETDLGQT